MSKDEVESIGKSKFPGVADPLPDGAVRASVKAAVGIYDDADKQRLREGWTLQLHQQRWVWMPPGRTV